MPSVSKKQADFMRAVAHSPEFAKKAGVPVSVGREFFRADQQAAERKKRRAAIASAMARK